MAPRPDDFVLVRRARGGDRAAFTALVERHQDRVFTLVRGIVRSPEDASDITQETFIAVLRHLDTFKEGARFSTWLHSIAVRKSYDALRRRVPVPVDPVSGAVAGLQSPFDATEAGLQRGDLLSAFAALDPGYRAAVLLLDVLGASVEEAAASLGIAPGTVKSRVFRGRAELARVLGTLGYEGASKP